MKSSQSRKTPGRPPLLLNFDDNRLLGQLFGEHDRHLARIEKELGVIVSSRGNQVSITGSAPAQQATKIALTSLYEQARRGHQVSDIAVSSAIRMAEGAPARAPGDEGWQADDAVIQTRRNPILARSPNQAEYIRQLRAKELVFGLGPAGTGKTFLAVAIGVSMILEGRVQRIILSRPAVEAGERLGFLPGDLRDKVDPYMRPLYDALFHMLPADRVAHLMESGEIEIAPLAFMRGRTLSNAFIILDEAQNTTPVQMKMALTRMGENSRMAVTGDLSQVDLPKGVRSGLHEAVHVLRDMEGVAFLHFGQADVVRHPLVTRIVKAYESNEAEQRNNDHT
ncbi:MAG: PhoH family protein [Alphaproteobacteria bacterium]|nr:PhoH family protein [Alphaproteobacteria bacterium]